VGTVACDICKRPIPYPDRYLMVDEDASGEEVNQGGRSVRYCIDCAKEKGYARYKEIKGEMMLTFLRESEPVPSTETAPPAAAVASAKSAKTEKPAKPAKASAKDEKASVEKTADKAAEKQKAPAKAAAKK